MLFRRLQILSHRENIDADGARIIHRLLDLVHLLGENLAFLERFPVGGIVMACNTSCAIGGKYGWPATREQVHEAMQYVPDEFVLKISATGTPAEARAKVQEYIDRGCTCPILYPMSDPQLMIDTFAVHD